ncbi:aminopeptidase [bacterium]|nr:aminopeptidase [bacterium]
MSLRNGYPEYPKKFVDKISDDLVFHSLRVEKADHVFIDYDPGASQVAYEVAKKVLALGASLDFRLRDECMNGLLKEGLAIQYLKRPDAAFLARIQCSDCYLSLRYADGNVLPTIEGTRERIWISHQKAVREEIVDEERTRRCGVSLPTPYQAQVDGMSFEEYLDVYFRACSLPWNEIEIAQEKLIQKLDKGHELKIEADLSNANPRKRTSLLLSIKEMTFANSTITKNYPGSEVFSAPVLTSVEGTYFSPGRFFYQGKLIRDIYLKFEKGRVVESDASEGRKRLLKILDFDSGSRLVGEIGIGTNRELIEDVSDTLLFEKKGSSFHIALGSPYHFSYYNGKKVEVDNGGESAIHWDLTQMLNREGGSRMLLDGELIQENGLFLDPSLEALNPRV